MQINEPLISLQGMYANVSVWVRSNGTAEFVSANATYLRSIIILLFKIEEKLFLIPLFHSTDITLSYTTIGKFDVST